MVHLQRKQRHLLLLHQSIPDLPLETVVERVVLVTKADVHFSCPGQIDANFIQVSVGIAQPENIPERELKTN